MANSRWEGVDDIEWAIVISHGAYCNIMAQECCVQTMGTSPSDSHRRQTNDHQHSHRCRVKARPLYFLLIQPRFISNINSGVFVVQFDPWTPNDAYIPMSSWRHFPTDAPIHSTGRLAFNPSWNPSPMWSYSIESKRRGVSPLLLSDPPSIFIDNPSM